MILVFAKMMKSPFMKNGLFSPAEIVTHQRTNKRHDGTFKINLIQLYISTIMKKLNKFVPNIHEKNTWKDSLIIFPTSHNPTTFKIEKSQFFRHIKVIVKNTCRKSFRMILCILLGSSHILYVFHFLHCCWTSDCFPHSFLSSLIFSSCFLINSFCLCISPEYFKSVAGPFFR